MAKLSPKMQEVMDDLVNAPYYYMVDGKTLEYLYTTEGLRGYWGKHAAAHIVTEGRVIIRECTNTIKALEKRGLVEVLEMGGASLDYIKLPGAQYEAPLTKARKITFTVTQYSDYCRKQLSQTFTHYAAEGADVEACIKEYRKGWDIVSIEDQGEVDVTVWNYKI